MSRCRHTLPLAPAPLPSQLELCGEVESYVSEEEGGGPVGGDDMSPPSPGSLSIGPHLRASDSRCVGAREHRTEVSHPLHPG
jgi:hypothetical protein